MKNKFRKCQIANCSDGVRSGAMCGMHYMRWVSFDRNIDHPGMLEPKTIAQAFCSVDGCDKKHSGKGFCGAHYKRWKKYGNPLAGAPCRGGLRATFETGDCLGALLVIEKPKTGKKIKCECLLCGEEKWFQYMNILQQTTTSCGCNRTAKHQATSMAKYGVQNPSQSPIIREKIIATNIARYGFASATQSSEIGQKVSMTFRAHFGKLTAEELANNAREHAKERRHTDPCFKLTKTLRTRLARAISGWVKGGSAVRDMGCSVPELRKYLEAKFYPHPQTGEQMSWENYNNHTWHIDHVVPINLFELTNREQLKLAVHYSNLQPLWKEHHNAKSAIDTRNVKMVNREFKAMQETVIKYAVTNRTAKSK